MINTEKSRLQFTHCDTLFATREEAVAYVTGDVITVDRPALYAEPMILKYGDETSPNILLAIGSVGDGVTQSIRNKVFLIDFAHLEESLEQVTHDAEVTAVELDELKSIVSTVMTSVGLNEKGEYIANRDNAILKNATSLVNADELLSQSLMEEVERAKSEEERIEKLFTSKNVNVADSYIYGDTILRNNGILNTEDGIWMSVDVSHSGSVINFRVNGVVTEIPNLSLESGRYSIEEEALILTLTDKSEVRVPLEDLIEEWDVMSEGDQKSPVVLKKTHIEYNDLVHGYENKDVLTAELRIKASPNNALKVDNAHELYVDKCTLLYNEKTNILRFNNGFEEKEFELAKSIEPLTTDTVELSYRYQNELQANVRLNTSESNIIKSTSEGLFADVQLSYDNLTGTLSFSNGVYSDTFVVSPQSLVSGVEYNEDGELVLKIELSDGTTQEVKVDIDKLEGASKEGSPITVSVDENAPGTKTVTASLTLSSKSNNLLSIDGNTLYASKSASDHVGSYREVDLSVQEIIDEIESEIDVLESKQIVLGSESTSKNFLEDEGVNGERVFAVREITTDSTKTSVDIEVAGLSSNLGAGFANGDVIPAGTSVEDILIKLLTKELYPDAATKPSIDIDGEKDFGLVEVYSSITVPSVSMKTSNGSFNASYTSVTQPAVKGVTFTNQTITPTVTGFNGVKLSAGSTSVNSVTTVASLGTNEVKYVSSANYTAPSNLPITNLRKETSKTGENAANGSAIWAAGTATKTVSTTAVGVYPCFTNISGGKLVSTVNTKLTLTKGNEFTINDVPSEVTNNQVFMFEFPATHSISSFKVKDLSGNYVDFVSSYTSNTVVNRDVNGQTVGYKRLMTSTPSQGVSSYKITLDKALNQ
ncbi:MAG: hypothetical protein IKT40_12105 [Bacilli bacterium]|nr:hypothetical protein [Bacilli bacterium]